jgi:hypothetical protein
MLAARPLLLLLLLLLLACRVEVAQYPDRTLVVPLLMPADLCHAILDST